jgi:hypothetical protein
MMVESLRPSVLGHVSTLDARVFDRASAVLVDAWAFSECSARRWTAGDRATAAWRSQWHVERYERAAGRRSLTMAKSDCDAFERLLGDVNHGSRPTSTHLCNKIAHQRKWLTYDE